MMIYDSFADWVEKHVLPLHEANPGWERLDGWNSTKGNPKAIAWLRYAGRVWRVHGDTRFAPVLAAYQIALRQPDAEPLVIEQAKSRLCLNLLPALQARSRPKYFHISLREGRTLSHFTPKPSRLPPLRLLDAAFPITVY